MRHTKWVTQLRPPSRIFPRSTCVFTYHCTFTLCNHSKSPQLTTGTDAAAYPEAYLCRVSLSVTSIPGNVDTRSRRDNTTHCRCLACRLSWSTAFHRQGRAALYYYDVRTKPAALTLNRHCCY
ncbi:hypothetical protein BaRGS_00023891 [Batillaria attramentaria]|uniref:Uncharacterized protein n=1 Tax=Batillaria attramentaria TaxID=370345 RepID=A0ABD0KCN8_9CAEN